MIRLFIAFNILLLAITACKNKSAGTSIEKVNSSQQTGYAPVNGLKMYYEIYGTGAPLVLIHGGGSTIGTSFGRILPSLAKKHKVIAVEMQAHGHTADINRPLSFEQDADDVRRNRGFANRQVAAPQPQCKMVRTAFRYRDTVSPADPHHETQVE